MSCPEFSADDHRYMARALQLARRGLYTTHPNPRVGCIIVRNNQIVGEGWHERAGEPHAEVHALNMAGESASGATAYVTLEPCSHHGRTPPCANALVQAGVKRVIAAMVDPNPLVAGNGLKLLQDAGIETASGLLESEARALNPGFISRMERNRPYIRLKMAMSLDGRTAMESGESVWITGDAARRDVQFLRAQAGAILTGIDTVLHDDPSLNVRLTAEELGIEGEVRQPVRVILDSKLRFPGLPPIPSPSPARGAGSEEEEGGDSCSLPPCGGGLGWGGKRIPKLLTIPGQTLIYTCSNDTDKITQLEQAGAQVRRFQGEKLQLSAVMTALVEDGINEVHVEAGATLSGALVEQGFADELVIYMAPHLMGSSARALFNLPHISHMKDRVALTIRDIRAVGADWRIIASLT